MAINSCCVPTRITARLTKGCAKNWVALNTKTKIYARERLCQLLAQIKKNIGFLYSVIRGMRYNLMKHVPNPDKLSY